MKILTQEEQIAIVKAGKEVSATPDAIISGAWLAKIVDDVDFAIEFIRRFPGHSALAEEKQETD